MGLFFSSSLSKREQAVFDVKIYRDQLKQTRRRLDEVAKQETAIALQYAATDKQKALRALGQKKYQERLLRETEARLDNIQLILEEIEKQEMAILFAKCLEEGQRALRALNKEVSVGRVQNLMDDTAEAIEYQRQVAGLLNQQLVAEEIDQVELEFEALRLENVSTQQQKRPVEVGNENSHQTEVLRNQNAQELEQVQTLLATSADVPATTENASRLVLESINPR